MAKYGLLIDYEFCVGCRVCELACKKEHNRSDDEYGIIVEEI
ncbi:4Fe-4S binding protein, partial [Thermodesulfobacteriota bacterium]